MKLSACPDARERAGPVFPPVGEEETQAQRSRGQIQRAARAVVTRAPRMTQIYTT